MDRMQEVTDYTIFGVKEDPRTRTWLLMSSIAEPLVLIAFYLCFVLCIGPKFMARRNPYNLTKTMIVINVMQVVVNLWIVKEHLQTGSVEGLKHTCNTVDYSNSPHAMRVAHVCWVYFIMKVMDLTDTILMVLRKKNGQVTILHLYHHVTLLFMAWLSVKLAPGGMARVPQLVNSMVHALMYTYYLLASQGPAVKPYLWWKKYLTMIQMIQLSAMATIAIVAVLDGCDYPAPLLLPGFPLVTINLSMFINFYYKNYCGKQKAL